MEVFSRIAQCRSQGALMDLLWKHFKRKGFHGIAYMIPEVTDPLKMVFDWRGFPDEYIQTYLEEEMYLVDPLPAQVARHASPIRLAEIGKHMRLSPEEKAYLERAKKMGVSDGYIIPTFGMEQRLAKFAIGQISDPSVLDALNIHEATAILQATHRRIDELAKEGKAVRPRLTRREVEILHWISKGKTNFEIARIIGISAPTVATHIKRLFHKLDVTDRAAAAAQGVKYGIVGA